MTKKTFSLQQLKTLKTIIRGLIVKMKRICCNCNKIYCKIRVASAKSVAIAIAKGALVRAPACNTLQQLTFCDFSFFVKQVLFRLGVSAKQLIKHFSLRVFSAFSYRVLYGLPFWQEVILWSV